RALRGLDPPRPAAVVEAVPGEPRPRRPRSEVAHSSTRQTNRRPASVPFSIEEIASCDQDHRASCDQDHRASCDQDHLAGCDRDHRASCDQDHRAHGPVRSAVLRAAQSPRGLRRILPGAATLAALVGIWIGAGALGNLGASHRAGYRVVPGAVAAAGGYTYVVRSGDTLWTIALRLNPNADPRPLVAELGRQLHGALLVPGDRLRLP
ncbi:MAG: LysM peptidoglycan-binding domain-containing protein, partial [Acidimicrobiales bacterium]